MSHYQQRLANDKRDIRRRVAAVGKRVRLAVAEAMAGLRAGDEDRCYQVVLGDLPINREIRDIDRRCHHFVARHLPSAGHLRFVSATLRINVAIERVGDYAVTIAREAVQLSAPPTDELGERLDALSASSHHVLARAIEAFAERDEQLARTTKSLTRQVHQDHGGIFRDLVAASTGLPLADRFALIAVVNQLERVSDQAKNLCEEALFELTGETKPPKTYRLLFLDADGTLLAPLAAALARQAFPEAGIYDCAAVAPGTSLAPALETLAAERGLDLAALPPVRPLAELERLERYHVIVALAPEAARQIGRAPFHTVLLDWTPPGPADEPRDERAGSLEAETAAGRLAAQIHELMVLLRGEPAA